MSSNSCETNPIISVSNTAKTKLFCIADGKVFVTNSLSGFIIEGEEK